MPVYLDHAATTPMVEACADALVHQMKELGNPSSLHSYGRAARKELELAREVIAKSVGCHFSEIIFTGSGTEANNSAIKGLFWRGRAQGRNVVVISAIEHHAILDPAHWLRDQEGAEVIEIGVTSSGRLDLNALIQLLSARADEIAVISIMSVG